jgi:UDP-2,3-diacylglucosamine pyrophosphatase LpxH
MQTSPAFSELFVVSDLHLGGDHPSRQIFDQGARFAALVDHLVKRPIATDPQGLVINGDLVDFLAQPDATYFDVENATTQLKAIVEAFPDVWAALQKFVATEGRRLVIVLGNHDLELALPWVRDALLNTLTDNKDERRGRVTLVFDGSGFRCTVGGATVLCVHGNEVDPWNVTDHETLRRVVHDCARGLPFRGWAPNAGSRLVIEVMNPIKRLYPFVDLLKPETKAVVPTLLALDPKKLVTIKAIAPAVQLLRDSFRMAAHFLGEDDASAGPEDELDPVLRGAFELGPADGDNLTAAALLEAAERRFRDNEDPYRMLGGARRTQTLSYEQAFWSWVRRKPIEEVLFSALESLKKDRSFKLVAKDDTFNDLDALVSSDMDFILAGHTHLERALKRKRKTSSGKDAFYYNTGTWARLMQYDRVTLGNFQQFQAVFQTLADTAGGMAALDKRANLVLRRPTVASIRVEQGKVAGRLHHVTDGNPLSDIENTKFEKA